MNRSLDRIALVTGGASGFGKAIAQRLASDGMRVVITDMQRELGAAVAAELGFVFIEQDVRDEARWQETMEAIRARHGGLHILVNNAGIAGPRDKVTPADTRLEDWNTVLAVNLTSVFLGCRAAIPVIAQAGGGSIVNISSITGLRASPHATAYGASKAAVRHLTTSVAKYCADAKLNIRCNSVHPGNVVTPLVQRVAEEESKLHGSSADAILHDMEMANPLGIPTRVEDIAAAVAFLVSDEARQITGEQLIIDGGVINLGAPGSRLSQP